MVRLKAHGVTACICLALAPHTFRTIITQTYFPSKHLCSSIVCFFSCLTSSFHYAPIRFFLLSHYPLTNSAAHTPSTTRLHLHGRGTLLPWYNWWKYLVPSRCPLPLQPQLLSHGAGGHPWQGHHGGLPLNCHSILYPRGK